MELKVYVMEDLFSVFCFVWSIWHVFCWRFLVIVVAATSVLCFNNFLIIVGHMQLVLFHLSKKFFDLRVVLTTPIDMKHLTCFPFRKFQLFCCLDIRSLGFLQQKYSIIITFYNRSIKFWKYSEHFLLWFFKFYFIPPLIISYFSMFVCRQNF
jgi:hypothetical protein